jgi:hypothetical protein
MKMFLDKIYKSERLFNKMNKRVNKVFIISLLILVFGAISVFAGNTFVNENGIQAGNYYSTSGQAGITQNIYYIGTDGKNYTLVIQNGLIVSAIEQGVSQNNSFPSEGLVLYYKLDETGGTYVYDAKGIYNGTNSGAIIDQQGKINKAYNFDNPSSDIIEISDITDIENTNTISISAWIYANSFKGVDVDGGIVAKRGYSPRISGDGWQILSVGTTDANHGKFQFAVWTPNEYALFTSGNNYLTNTWYHIVAVYNGTTEKIYINGVLENSGGAMGTISNSNAKVSIGNYWTGGSGFDGKIDEVGLWNRELTDTEITALYNSSNGLPSL